MIHASIHALRWKAEAAAQTDRLWRELRNERRRERRRQLYRTDPLWRLSKLKANRETRLRAKRRQG